MSNAFYKKDCNLPVHGRRAKADNAGCVRVGIEMTPWQITEIGTKKLFLNIDTKTMVYNIKVEQGGFIPKEKDKGLSQDLLRKIVEIAGNEEFMSLKNKDIFPNIVQLDGDTIKITVKSDKGNVSLDNGLLEETLKNGYLETTNGKLKTPFHRLWKLA